MATWNVIINNAETFTVKAGQTLNVTASGLPCRIVGTDYCVDVKFTVLGGTCGSMLFPGMKASLEGRDVKVVRV